MKIISKQSVLHKKVITVIENFAVKIKVGGKIINLDVDTEDGQVEYWKGKTPKEQQKINMLKMGERKEIETMLENETFE